MTKFISNRCYTKLFSFYSLTNRSAKCNSLSSTVNLPNLIRKKSSLYILTAADKKLKFPNLLIANRNYVVAHTKNMSNFQREKEKFLNMSLEEKRTFYKCGQNYTLLSNIPSWRTVFLNKKSPGSKESLKAAADSHLADKVCTWKGDITTLEIDAIVNAANNSLLGGGGVDGAIHRAAGSDLKNECASLNGCETGDAKITGGYKLPAKYVIHTVGPVGAIPEKLKSCYETCLNIAKENNLRTVAFPCISTGVYGYPNEEAAHVALGITQKWLKKNNNAEKVDRIIFCLFLPVDVTLYSQLLPVYFPVEEF